MALIKYSIGGQITTVVDNDSVQEKELTAAQEQPIKLAVCNNCGIQHSIEEGRTCKCDCGNIVRLN